MKEVWYAKIGSNPDKVKYAIAMSRLTGSIGITEEEVDESGTVLSTVTVRREGHQGDDYYKVEDFK
jgi:hypothetical protein